MSLDEDPQRPTRVLRSQMVPQVLRHPPNKENIPVGQERTHEMFQMENPRTFGKDISNFTYQNPLPKVSIPS
jgi:hypothetical protein